MSPLSNITTVLADIGNSCSKLAGVDAHGNTLVPLATIPDNAVIQIDAPSSPLNWFICSVSPSQTTRLTDWIHENRPADSHVVLKHQDIPLELKVDAPDKVGVDRLVAATAAHAISDGKDVVVIDAGTAVTIDAVSDNQFLGGTIFPGCQTAFESLRQNAEQLPLIDEYHLPDEIVGKSTSKAIQAGVMFGQIGSIRYIAEQIAQQLNDPMFVMTGGGLTPLLGDLPNHWIHIPHLVLDGVRRIARSCEQSK